MKKVKIIFGALAALLLMSGCEIDRVYSTDYEYVNNTAWPLSVTINMVYPDYPIDNFRDEPVKFELAPGDSYILNLSGEGGFNPPFLMKYGFAYSVVVSNGKSLVVSKSREDDIFHIDKYTLVSSTKIKKHYQFIIEPEFFDNAEPINESNKNL